MALFNNTYNLFKNEEKHLVTTCLNNVFFVLIPFSFGLNKQQN